MTPEHRDAQRRLYEHHAHSLELRDVVLEAPIPMEWRDKGRVADLLVGAPGGFQIVHEVQVSPIRRAELERRSKDYLEAGIARVVWWLGFRSPYINDLDLEGVETLRLDELNQDETRHASRLSRWLEMMAAHVLEGGGVDDPSYLSRRLHGHPDFGPVYAPLFETREYTFTPWNLLLKLKHENAQLHARTVELERALGLSDRTNEDLKGRVANLEQIPLANAFERRELEKRRREDEVLKKLAERMLQVLLREE
jgi:hypothetical protein